MYYKSYSKCVIALPFSSKNWVRAIALDFSSLQNAERKRLDDEHSLPP
ncbi:hypothetical protein [Nostoc sp.]